MAEMMSVCVDPKRINEAWPHFKHWIKDAIETVGLIEFERHERDVLNGKALLWLAYDGKTVHAAATTELINGVCEISACGGEGILNFLPLLENLEQFARDEKCKAVRIAGRAGWARLLKNYKVKSTILESAL